MSGTSTAYRLVIAGLGAEAVTDPAMEQTTADGRVRLRGLLRDGLSIDEEVDIARAKIEASGMTPQVVDLHPDDAWTSWFAWQPQTRSWLTADVAASGAVNVDVASTSDFSAGDVIHIGTEAMLVDTVASSTRLTVASGGRGYWDTIAQAHYTEDGARLTRPIVTQSRPTTLEGRRAYLYRYELGDDLTGDGTLIWRGVCVTDAALSEDGTTWSLTIDPITSLLAQDMGGDLDEPTTIRGVFYFDGALTFSLYESTDYQGLEPVSGKRCTISMHGHWETQQDFCDDLTEVIQQAVNSGATVTRDEVIEQASTRFTDSGKISAFVHETGHWGIRWDATGGNYLHVDYQGVAVPSSVYNIDGALKPIEVDDSGDVRALVSGDGASTNKGLTPRGHFAPQFDGVEAAAGETPATLYLNGVSSVSDGDLIEVTWDGVDAPITTQVLSSSASDGYVVTREIPTPEDAVAMYPGKLPSIRVFRVMGRGTLAAFRDSLVADAPTLTNIGGAPFLTSEDLADWTDVVDEAAGGRPLAQRTFVLSQSIGVDEFLAHECRLINVYPALSSDGKIGLRVLRLPTPTSVSAVTIDASTTLVSERPPSWERNAFGSINTGELKTGYSYADDDWHGITYRPRDVTALSTRKAPRQLNVEPKSSMRIRSGERPFDYTDAVDVFRRVFGIFGRPYSVVTVDVPYTLLTTALVGEVAALSSHRIPDVRTGARGVGIGSSRVVAGLIVKRSWDLAREVGTLTLIVSDADTAGYAPSLWIDSSSNVSGNTYDLTVSFDDPTGAESFAPAGAVVSDFFSVGDEVSMIDFDTSSSTVETGEIDAINDTTGVVRVTFDGSVTISGEQYLRFSVSDDPVEAGQRIFAFYGNAFYEVDFSSETKPAKEYAG